LKYKEELHAGIGFFFTTNVKAVYRLGIRPFQGYRLTWPNRERIDIQHYVRLKERFEIETSDWKNTFGLRIRYMAEIVLKLQGDLIPSNKAWFLPIGMELFWNLVGTKQFNDNLNHYPGNRQKIIRCAQHRFFCWLSLHKNTVEESIKTNDIIYRLRVDH